MHKALIISEPALQRIVCAELSIGDLLHPTEGSFPAGIVFSETDDFVAFWAPGCGPSTRLMVMDLATDGGQFERLQEDLQRQAFDRSARLALRCFDRAVSLNFTWRPFHAKNFV